MIDSIRNLAEAAGKGGFAFVGGLIGGCIGFVIGFLILQASGDVTSSGTATAGDNARTGEFIFWVAGGGIVVGAGLFLAIQETVQDAIASYRERQRSADGHHDPSAS